MMRSSNLTKKSLLALGAVFAAGSALTQSAFAQTPPPAEQTGLPGDPATSPAQKPSIAPANFGEWASSIKLSFQGNAGIVINTSDPQNHRNFGRLFTDNSNRPTLNQLLFGVQRDVAPQATSIDVGFKLQLAYGSDSRVTHTLGVFDQLIHDRNQIDVAEATISVRFPSLFARGLDIKAGIYPTPLGVEMIDPKTNAFYSHSYIFSYGSPYKHTGVLATAHVSDLLDIYGGIDSGTNTFIGYGSGDNNNRPAGIAGFGLKLAEGRVVILALTHIGPEDSKRNTSFANTALRYYNDASLVWKITTALTLTTEINYVREEGFRAEAYGITQYAAYTLSDTVTLNGRVEIFRDSKNFFVSNPQGNLDYANAQRGTSTVNLITAPRPTTYGGLTAGVTYKPPGMPAQLSTFLVRPELRYDQTLNNSRPFNGGRDRGAFTLATDFVIGF